MLFQLKVPDQNVCIFNFFNSAKSIFAVILSVVTAVYFAGTTSPIFRIRLPTTTASI